MNTKILLRRFSKLTCLSTCFLIFAGGLVTSTGSGLSVPDWPLSYGMVFPPMVGGVFYEHGHRMIASVVGFFMLILAILLWKYETRRWLKNLGFVALGAVIIQGILGGITVKFFLPLPVSVSHGVLAQSFFVMTIVIAYSLSLEREGREAISKSTSPFVTDKTMAQFLRLNLFLLFCVLLQLIVGAIMRHMHAGLAVLDFPKIAGEWWPKFDPTLLTHINAMRYELNLEPVSQPQVFFHILHRIGAIILLFVVISVNWLGLTTFKDHPLVKKSIFILDIILATQITLGIATILSHKEYHITSLHVVTGAITLGWIALLFLRAAPIQISQIRSLLFSPSGTK